MKGAIAKNTIFTKLMEVFPNSFMYNDNKELRINTTENGEPVQIKLSLTCAKTPVESNNSNTMSTPESSGELNWEESKPSSSSIIEQLTQEEKENVARLVKQLRV